MGHRLFLEGYHKIKNIFKHIVKLEEIHFILNVDNGIHIIIHTVDMVYLHEFKYK